EVRELLSPHGIPLVLDATRLLENALWVQRYEQTDRAGGDLWETARQLASTADIITASLTKDFAVNVGGVIALSDDDLNARLRDAISTGGSGLNRRDLKLMARAVSDREEAADRVAQRVAQVARLSQRLRAGGLPVAGPAGTHCVLLDSSLWPGLQGEAAEASLVAHIFRQTGIRAARHSSGLRRDTPLGRMIRLAVPLGLGDQALEAIGDRLIRLWQSAQPVPALEVVRRPPGFFGETKTVYRSTSQSMSMSTATAISADREAVAPAVPELPGTSSTRRTEPRRQPRPEGEGIAIVGLAGRYPEADSLEQFWENLAAGRDGIREIPQERWDYRQRAALGMPELNRGGFLSDVDRFDSRFFSIAPREAVVMDPQERLFLEVAWAALEDAGYLPETLVPEGEARNVGVFVGAVWTFYQTIGAEEAFKGNVVGPNSYLWAVANRVSYFMDFTGPSLAVDTACSSSLTALHMACEAIRRGSCRAAIAGGVNLDLHPSKRVVTAAGGFLSPDSRCAAFGADANGYVAGEGVGAVLLKPLADAERDGDLIHGVIRATAVNHGGKASGFTVPGVKAQRALIGRVFERAGVDAHTISCVEAHGTGTKLGDPIEVQALTAAYRDHLNASHADDRGFCAIGSVKSNIGHLEAAAGSAGLTKLLLQLRHRQLAPSLHTERLNELIDFASTPFVVQRESAPWPRPIVDGHELPRRAGLSSFGAGGSNAHLIVEEHVDGRPQAVAAPGAEVFVLSARDEDRLRAYAERFAAALEAGRLAGLDLRDVTYTLQLGRRSLEHRVAVVAGSYGELLAGLQRFLAGDSADHVMSGRARNAASLAALIEGDEREEIVRVLVRGGKPHKLARLWCDGVLPDWRDARPADSGRRVSLPTYPFARVRHWIGTDEPVSSSSGLKPLHTFIDANVSTLGRQAYRKTFSAEHFVLRDHVVDKLPTLPGVGYLEMARAAGELATGGGIGVLENIVWSRPIALDAARQDVVVELTQAADHLQFEMRSDDAERELYARGRMFSGESAVDPSWSQPVDLEALRGSLTRHRAQSWCYELMREGGIVHRETYQTIQELWHGEDSSLSRLVFPRDLLGSFGDLVLHPSMLDGATQTTLGLWEERGIPYVPFVMGKVHILRPVPERGWAYAQRVGRAGDSRKYHITLMDDAGVPCVAIRDFTMMPFVRRDRELVRFAPRWQEAPLGPSMAKDEALLVVDASDAVARALATRRWVVWVRPGDAFRRIDDNTFELDLRRPEDFAELCTALDRSQRLPGSVLHLVPADEAGMLGLLFLIQAMRAATSPSTPLRVLHLYAAGQAAGDLVDGAQYARELAVGAFARTVGAEMTALSASSVGLEGSEVSAATVAHLDAVLSELSIDRPAGGPPETHVRWVDGRRQVLQWVPWAAESQPSAVELRDGGAYLITGGAGGLGLVLAEHLIARGERESRAVQVVLSGRSKQLEGAVAERFDRLKTQAAAAGCQLRYLAADVGDLSALQGLLAELGTELRGVIHAAGVLRDNYFWNQTAEDFLAVLRPKIDGALNLDQVCRQQPLDFFVLFSSVAGVQGNAGQSAYAYANAFLNAFAEQREAARRAGRRSGRTVAIAWPLWQDGGMSLDERLEQHLLRTWGMKPLPSDKGLEVFDAALSGERPVLMVVHGESEKIHRVFGPPRPRPAVATQPASTPAIVSAVGSPPSASVAAAVAPAAVAQALPAAGDAGLDAALDTGLDDVALLARLRERMWDTLEGILGLSQDDVDFEADMSDFGFDSITFTEFTDDINRQYGLDVTPVIFFEYPTLGGLSGHVFEQHRDQIAAHFGASSARASSAPDAQSVSTPIAISNAVP
ncbi:MAG: SDR family NAD(P)-dependent oxidoreductase, partial [Acidobacteriota bacterium]